MIRNARIGMIGMSVIIKNTLSYIPINIPLRAGRNKNVIDDRYILNTVPFKMKFGGFLDFFMYLGKLRFKIGLIFDNMIKLMEAVSPVIPIISVAMDSGI